MENQNHKPTHLKSGDYDALINHAVDVKDATWARTLYTEKVTLAALEAAVREDIGFMN